MGTAPVGFEFNRRPELADEFDLAPNVYLVDSTIRSLQSTVSGSCHATDDLIEIGVLLDELGVREQIINVSWAEGVETIRGLRERGVDSRLVATFRARSPRWKDWVAAAADSGADEVCLESSRDEEQLAEAASAIADTGLRVSHAFAEAYAYGEVVKLLRVGVDLGLTSQNFHDSYFRMAITPEAIRLFLRSLRLDVPNHPPLYVHLSNFFGHATMTAVAAITAGASAVDVCANGSGHHCGHTSLPEVALVLERLYGISTGIKTELLAPVAREIRQRTGIPMALSQPVVGDFAFLQDGAYIAAEAHLAPDARMHATFPIPASSVGAEERVVWNHRTVTPEAVAAKLMSLGLAAPQDGQVEDILERLRARLSSAPYPSWVSDEEFIRLVDGRVE